MSRNTLTLWLLAASVAGCGGAGGPAVKVSGTLLKGGVKYQVPADQKLNIVLVAIEVVDEAGKTVPSNEPYQAIYEPSDGTFQVPGKDGYGIPPGKYRVAITLKMTREAFNVAQAGQKKLDREKDYLDDRFSPAKSPIVREIKAGTSLSVDLDRPTEGGPAA